ncbi:hypothetical protein KW794_03395 [Candidatus Saccharibacteria bacterium]|nr:hypothetical protein [Candidatus Saccharibacteria bacterium]
MAIETKRPSLIPRLDESLELVRDRHFGTKWPPETNGDLPGYKPASKVVVEESNYQAENVKSTRRQEKRVIRKVVAYGATILSAGGLVFAANELAHARGNVEHGPWEHHNKPTHTKAN